MYLKILILIFLIISCFIKNEGINNFAIGLILYFLFKWITNYRKCTMSYIECKLRGVKKEKGIIYNLLEPLFDINKSKYYYLIYLIFIIFLFINIININNYSMLNV